MTLLLLLMRLRSVTDRTWDGWHYHCFYGETRASLSHSHSEIHREKSQQKKIQSRLRWCGGFPIGKRKDSVWTEIFTNSLRGKLIKPSMENVQLRQKITEAQSELDRREWRMQGADRALYETGIQLQSQRMEFSQANQLTGQTQREKSWLCNESEMKNRAFQGDRARSSQEFEELRKICYAEAERARQLRIAELSFQKEESESAVNQLLPQIQDLQDKVNSLSDARDFFTILKLRAALDYPRSESACEYSQSKRFEKPRFLSAACYTELIWYIRTRF